MSPGGRLLLQWMAREDDNIMPLFGGKTSGARPDQPSITYSMHKTETVYRRYPIVTENDRREERRAPHRARNGRSDGFTQ